jgi:hypothetical protein
MQYKDDKTGLVTFRCDACRLKFETTSPGFKGGWEEAAADGWVQRIIYRGSISALVSLCPAHIGEMT